MEVTTGSIPQTGVPFKRDEYDRRCAAVVRQFELAQIDALCVTAVTHLQYLTGYSGRGTYFGPYTVVIVPDERPTFVVREYDEDSVRTESWVEDVVPYTQRADQPKVLARVLHGFGLDHGRVGFELDSWNLAPADMARLEVELPEMTVVDATRVVPAASAVKSESEIVVMREAMAITKMAVATFNASLEEGVSELQVWREMLGAAADAGGPLAPSSTLVFGARTALPHGYPSPYRLGMNEPAFTEVAGVVHGYQPGLCRTAILGRHSAAESLYAVADEALRAGIEAARPGATAGDVDAACREVVGRAGRAKSFRHRAGYQNGIGWSYRGDMSLEPGAEDVLVAGMTVHLPIILFSKGEFAVGCSETLLVTDAGPEVLSGGGGGLVLRR